MMASYIKNKPNHTGRNKWAGFVKLPHETIESPAYRALCPNARALLIELIRLHNGSNNGTLWLSVRDAADRMGVVDLKAARNAFDELQQLGFIVMTAEAHFAVKTSETARARCWRLTFEPVEQIRKAATHDYRKVSIPEGRSEKRAQRGLAAVARWKRQRDKNKTPVLENHTLEASLTQSAPAAVLKSNTALTENCGFQKPSVVEECSTHTVARGRG